MDADQAPVAPKRKALAAKSPEKKSPAGKNPATKAAQEKKVKVFKAKPQSKTVPTRQIAAPKAAPKRSTRCAGGALLELDMWAAKCQGTMANTQPPESMISDVKVVNGRVVSETPSGSVSRETSVLMPPPPIPAARLQAALDSANAITPRPAPEPMVLDILVPSADTNGDAIMANSSEAEAMESDSELSVNEDSEFEGR